MSAADAALMPTIALIATATETKSFEFCILPSAVELKSET
jgi:hypothetical protein